MFFFVSNSYLVYRIWVFSLCSASRVLGIVLEDPITVIFSHRHVAEREQRETSLRPILLLYTSLVQLSFHCFVVVSQFSNWVILQACLLSSNKQLLLSLPLLDHICLSLSSMIDIGCGMALIMVVFKDIFKEICVCVFEIMFFLSSLFTNIFFFYKFCYFFVLYFFVVFFSRFSFSFLYFSFFLCFLVKKYEILL